MMPRLRSASFLVGLAVFAGSLAVYVATLAPSLSWGWKGWGVDGGELLAAANTFGVPHPPGYPTYMLLLRAFAEVVRVGDFAYRGNLFSAVCAAGALTLLYASAFRLGRTLFPDAAPRVAAAGAALGAAVLGAAPVFWALSVVTEVYALNALFCGALLHIATRVTTRPPGERPHSARYESAHLGLFGLLLGLGLGNHLTLLAVGVPLAYWMGFSVRWRWQRWAWAAGALALGLCVYLYLPLRAGQHPPINWGGADSLGGVVWMLSGRPYQDYVFGVDASTLPSRLLDWLQLVFGQLNPLGIFIGLLGLGFLRVAERRLFEAVLATILLITAYAIAYNSFDFQVLTIPSFLVYGLAISLGLTWLVVEWLPRVIVPRPQPGKPRFSLAAYDPALALIAATFVLLPVLSFSLNLDDQSLRDDREAADLARRMMAEMPDGSVVLAGSETHVFPLWYETYVEQPEREVAVVATLLLQFVWYRRDLHEEFPDLVPAQLPGDIDEAARVILRHNLDGGRVYSTYTDRSLAQEFRVEGIGDLFQIKPLAEQ
ncbi:MAG: DUF2723 domain-containing protein [SAR202 cluster bacterium]|nr:DUF2723 domain-containing protein [SAR202 cluster bacterium]